MALGIVLLITGWLMITPGARKNRAWAVLGMLVITAAMLSIVQARY